MENLTVFDPQVSFWIAKILILQEDEFGKLKKSREIHVVDGKSVADVENKVKEYFKDIDCQFSIQSIGKSPITTIYK